MEKLGQVGWIDLTVPDAEAVRDFYQHVTGWTASPVDMGGYQDYCMNPPGAGQPVAGICHARGVNAGLPPVWMIYITVAELVRLGVELYLAAQHRPGREQQMARARRIAGRFSSGINDVSSHHDRYLREAFHE
jgi:hypothetical protein